ncbi:hypothetical protein G647_06481 [Cladophialophora carrionii CBS 160.54]|uniref:Uncharacterized protein n=1 Tax=Cladophialophora carrionii CBS 160.54 TaxID=1279043 RepID=V9D701_9EURO|nr:uncharacterized protein G647_06481 [Cladophialophora carrionii CBS 160.54]ETI22406.1 hypothetical protein G647_06481 [Cladophialophora carrionii CBS 160.54]
MAPIPVHTASAINTNLPSHALGTSPSTAGARYTPSTAESRPSSTEPALGASPSQPARAAVPHPTNTAASTHNSRCNPTPTAPLQPASLATSENTPPPPQPGAVPSPYSISPTPRASAPASPRCLNIPQPSAYASPDASPPRVTAAPTQAQTPTHSRPLPIHPATYHSTVCTPVRSVPSAGVTSISTSPSYNYTSPTYSLPKVPEAQDLSHPPGYQQDHHSSFDDKPIESCQETDYRATLSPMSATRRGAGILDLEWTFGSPNGSADGDNTVVQTAMSWARAAGKRLSMTEKQIWKTINGEEDGR